MSNSEKNLSEASKTQWGAHVAFPLAGPLAELVEQLSSGHRPSVLAADGPAVYYGEDPDTGEEYAFVEATLPAGVYAEIDSETYGTLWGFRVYLDSVENPS